MSEKKPFLKRSREQRLEEVERKRQDILGEEGVKGIFHTPILHVVSEDCLNPTYMEAPPESGDSDCDG